MEVKSSFNWLGGRQDKGYLNFWEVSRGYRVSVHHWPGTRVLGVHKEESHMLLHRAVCLPGYVTSSGGAKVGAWVTGHGSCVCALGHAGPGQRGEDQDGTSRV